jgi:Holliday junction resolvase
MECTQINQMPINSKQKGNRGEREVARILTKSGFKARRGQQFSGSPDSPDVLCESLPIHFEVKTAERLNLYAAFEQAVSDRGAAQVPVVVHKRKRKRWMVTLEFEDFLWFLRKLYIHEKDD